MKDMFLLGAGASVEAGVPDAYKMTIEMLDAFSKDRTLRNHNKILRFVVGGLLFQQAAQGENPLDGVNVEELFNAVLLLGERKNSELSSFVGSWHPLLSELEGGEISDHTAEQILDKIYRPILDFLHQKVHINVNPSMDFVNASLRFDSHSIDTFFSRRPFQEILTQSIREFVAGSGGRVFIDTSNQMTQKLIQMAWIIDPQKIDYLRPLVKYARHTGAVITTLNYDNTIELSSETSGLPFDTGIGAWSGTSEFTFAEDHIPLIKLHGSINWALSEIRASPEKPLQHESITRVMPTDNANFHPEIIFGGKNKLTVKGPFLGLLRVFELQLAECNRLIVIGYSFRDDHVNEFIRNWLNSDPNRTLVIINPNIAKLDVPFYQELSHIPDKARVLEIAKTASDGILEITSKPPEAATP